MSLYHCPGFDTVLFVVLFQGDEQKDENKEHYVGRLPFGFVLLVSNRITRRRSFQLNVQEIKSSDQKKSFSRKRSMEKETGRGFFDYTLSQERSLLNEREAGTRKKSSSRRKVVK